MGIGTGSNFEYGMEWIGKGAQWLSLANDVGLMIQAADELVGRMRSSLANASKAKA